MALTLTATFNEATGTVALTATSSINHVYGAYSIMRSDATGTATVRTQEGLGFSSGTLYIIDHEPALSGLVTYTITAAGETARTGVTPVTARTWLKFPIMPHLSVELGPVGASYEGAFEPNDAVYSALDRDDPIIVFGTFGLRRGRFEVLCDTYEDALEIVNAYRETRIALVQIPDPARASMYHAARRLTVRKFRERTSQWLVVGEYTEVGRPVGPVLGTLGWSYADVVTDHTTYDDVIAAYATYHDLVVGPTA